MQANVEPSDKQSINKPKITTFLDSGPNTRQGRERSIDLSLISANSYLSKREECDDNNTSLNIGLTNARYLSFLPSARESRTLLRQVSDTKLQDTTDLSSVYQSSAKAESLVLRQCERVSHSVSLAEVLVQNVADEHKALVLPEKRRKELVKHEVRKLIFFVARQFNVSEELRCVIGSALEELDVLTYHRSSNVDELSFFCNETPPNLSLNELTRVTYEMEKWLKTELEKRGNKPLAPPISAERVSSNLAEILWIIESLQIEFPNVSGVDLDSENSGLQNALKIVRPISTESNTTTPNCKEVQRRQLRPQLQEKKKENDNNEKGGTQLLFQDKATKSIVADLQRNVTFSSASGTKEGSFLQCSFDDDANDKSIGFSVDEDSSVSGLVDGKELNLLQFMYDAIKSDNLGMDCEKKMDGGIDSAYQTRRSGVNGLADGAYSSTKRSDISYAPGMTALTTAETDRYFLSTMGNSFNNTYVDFDEESEDTVAGANVSASVGQSFSLSVLSPRQQSAQTPLWVKPVQPAVRVQPLRRNLLDILRELYTNFNYNYYFQQFKPKQKECTLKSEREYSEELELKLTRQIDERRQKSQMQNEDGDISLVLKNCACQTNRLAFTKRCKAVKSNTFAIEEETDLSQIPLETSLHEDLLDNQQEAANAGWSNDGAILLTEEIGEGFMFVLKGQKTRGLLSADSASKRESGGGLTSLKKKNKGQDRKRIILKRRRSHRDGSASDETDQQFDSYILYALNHSNTPQRAFVNVDLSKLQNLKLKVLFNFSLDKKPIAVDLAPYGSKAVLSLRPKKKKRQVMFDGAFCFSEVAPTNEFTKQKSSIKEKSFAPRKSEALSDFSGLNRTNTSSTLRICSSVGEHSISSDALRKSKAAEDGIKNGCKENNVATTEENEDSLRVASAAHSQTHENSSILNKGEMDEENSFVLSDNHEGKFSRRKKEFSMLMFRPTCNEGRASFTVDAMKTAEANSDFLDFGAVPNIDSGLGVTIPRNDKKLKKQNETARQKGEVGKLTKSSEARSYKGGKRETACFNNDVSPKKKGKKKVGDDSSAEVESVSLKVAASDQREVLPDHDKEAFEKNCVVLSVLQASAWRSDSTFQEAPSSKSFNAWSKVYFDDDDNNNNNNSSNSAQGRRERGEEKDGVMKTATMDEAQWPKGPSKSILQTTSRKCVTATAGKQPLEEGILSFFGNDNSAGEIDAERSVMNVLQRIADEEQLGGKGVFQEDSTMSATEQADGIVRVGSILSWQNLPSKQQHNQFPFGHKEKTRESFLFSGKELEGFPPLKSINQLENSQDRVQSAYLRKNSVGYKEGIFETHSFPQLASNEHLPHLNNASGTILSESTYSADEMKKKFPDEHLLSDNGCNLHAKMTEADVYGFYCESCACALNADHHLDETKIGDEATLDEAGDAALSIENMGEMQNEVVASTVFTFEGSKESLTNASLPAAKRSQRNLETLLEGVKKASTKAPSPLSFLLLRSKRQRKALSLPFTQKVVTPTRHHAYTESRPGGRVVIFAPEEAGSTNCGFSSKTGDKDKAMDSILATTGQTEAFAKGICSSLHACARLAATNRSNRAPGAYGDSTLTGRAVERKKDISEMRGATLSTLTVLCTGEKVQEVEDLEAAEEEARELFLLDPVRYDCVVDDLVKLAIARVQKEEEREALETLAKKGSFKSSEDTYLPRGKLRSLCSSNFLSTVLMPASKSNSIKTSTGLIFGGSNDKVETGSASLSANEQTQVAITCELQRLLDEQRRAKRLVAFVLMEMRRMWQRREMEANLALRIAVERFIYRSLMFSWHFERRRVLNLRKLISLLDRKTSCAGGWMPFYAKDSVVEERFVWEPAPPHLSRPLRVVHRAMCLARRQRLFPLRLVRFQAHQRRTPTPHLLYGYKRTLLEPFTTTGTRLRGERRARRAAPFQHPSARFSPQPLWLHGRARNQS